MRDADAIADFTAARQDMLRAWTAIVPQLDPMIALDEAAATASAMRQILLALDEPGGTLPGRR